MAAPSPSSAIVWRVRLASNREAVFDLLATDAGRARFWARTITQGRRIGFVFADGSELSGEILEVQRPGRLRMIYAGADTRFDLEATAEGGCVLTLTASGVPPEDRLDVHAGWVSVLLILKAVADFGVDLRNGRPDSSWAHHFVDQ